MNHVSLLGGIVDLIVAGLLGWLAKWIVAKLDPAYQNIAGLVVFVLVLLIEFGVGI
jgi:hypothetical protein